MTAAREPNVWQGCPGRQRPAMPRAGDSDSVPDSVPAIQSLIQYIIHDSVRDSVHEIQSLIQSAIQYVMFQSSA